MTHRKHPPVKLTKTVVEGSTPPESGRLLIRDTEIRGFGIKITPNGVRTFFLERRVVGEQNAKRITLGRYPDLTVDAARKKAQEHAGVIAKGGNPVAEKKKTEAEAVKLSEALAGYLKDRDLKPLTKLDCERVLKRNLKDWMNRRVLDITHEGVRKRYAALRERSEAQANLTMRYLRAVLNYAAAVWTAPDGTPLLVRNPVRTLTDAKAWATVDRRRTSVRETDLKPWVAAVLALDNDVVRDFFQVVILTGLRKEEALGLTWERVNLTDVPITVMDAKGNPLEVPKKALCILDTKAKRPHLLPLSDYLVEVFTGRQKAAETAHQKRLKKDPEATRSPLAFSDGLGRKLSNLRYNLDKVAEASGVKFCLHDLRRSFATIAESLDVPAYALKHLLNHSTKADVTGGYIMVDVERLRRPMQAITDHVLRKAGLRGGGEVIELPTRASAV